MSAELLDNWLGSVNQPVVDNVQSKIKELLVEISDRDNFTKEQCKQILTEIIKHES